MEGRGEEGGLDSVRVEMLVERTDGRGEEERTEEEGEEGSHGQDVERRTLFDPRMLSFFSFFSWA